MKLFLCILAITLCATSSLKLFKSTKEQIKRAPLKYNEGKAQIQIQELCNTVCSQYSEEYLNLKKETEQVDNARVQEAQAQFVTCHLKCSLSIKAQLKSLQ
ncbi:Peptidase [Trichinella spiralis]|uniref:Peptidase n=1 Tax=Trichinella spiralis TaxID=6334 RepID=A0ABR3KDD7_TRISP